MVDAACRGEGPKRRGDLDMFFPEKGQSSLGNKAITFCFDCPVRKECRAYKKATNSDHGIWAAEYSKRSKT